MATSGWSRWAELGHTMDTDDTTSDYPNEIVLEPSAFFTEKEIEEEEKLPAKEELSSKEKESDEESIMESATDRLHSINACEPQHKLYPIRYLMLVALVILNISNGMMWLSFSPVPSLTASFYGISLSDVDWFSNSYFITSLIIGFISIVVLDVFGLRTAVICGTIFNLLGAILRYISTVEPIVCSQVFPKAGFATAIIGQILTACAQPFFLYAPAKLANTWFGSKERGICTNLASVANPIGIAVAQLVSPGIVTDVSKLPTMLWIYILPAGIGAIFSLSFLYRSSPPVPPTPSGDIPQLPFLKGVRSTLTNWNFLVLLATWGLGAGVLNAVLIIVPQYLCPYGYTNKAVGLWASLFIISGLVGATVAGLLIDRTKLFKEIGVGGLVCTILSLIWFLEVGTMEGQPYLIAASLCATGFFALSFMPVAMELGVEVTYPAAEATSSGFLWSSAQVFGFVFVTIGQLISPNIDPLQLDNNQCDVSLTSNNTYSVCSNRSPVQISGNITAQNWTNCGILFIVMATFAYLLFVFLFRPHYKRQEFEMSAENK